MRTKEVQRIRTAAWRVAERPGARGIEVILALQVVAATHGLILGEVNPELLTDKAALILRTAKSRLVQDALRRKELERQSNRRAYLRRRLRQLENGGVEGIEAVSELPEPGDADAQAE